MTNTIHILSYPLPDAWETAVDGWQVWLTAGGSSPATRRTRRCHVRSTARQLGTAAPGEVTTAQLVEILGQPFSADHRRGLRASLRHFYRYCHTAGLVDADPTVTLPSVPATPGTPRPATDEIWRHILDTADTRTLLMARLACEAGLRRAEVAAVHTDDLTSGLGGADLIVHGKGGRQRVVPITVTLATEIAKAQPFGGFLFPGKIDGHISADRVGHLVAKAMPRGWSMHKLRHRFATRGYAGTRNLRAIQEVLGHASVATTQRYTAVTGQEVRAVSEAAAWHPLAEIRHSDGEVAS